MVVEGVKLACCLLLRCRFPTTNARAVEQARTHARPLLRAAGWTIIEEQTGRCGDAIGIQTGIAVGETHV